jgi:hypothetical protein
MSMLRGFRAHIGSASALYGTRNVSSSEFSARINTLHGPAATAGIASVGRSSTEPPIRWDPAWLQMFTHVGDLTHSTSIMRNSASKRSADPVNQSHEFQ